MRLHPLLLLLGALAAAAPGRAQGVEPGPADAFADAFADASADAFPGPAALPGATFAIVIPLGRPVGAPRLTRRQLAELGAVVLTGVGHLAAASQEASAYYIPVVIGGWGGYVGYRAATEPGFLGELGLTGQDLGPAFRDASIVAAGATAGMLLVGAARGTLRVGVDLLPLLVLYPAWGLTQQVLVQGFVTRHLTDAGLPRGVVTPVAAATFGAVHVPNWPLTVATTALGAVNAELYRRHRNLWPLGLYHGVLGAEFYVWVLGRDPWGELTGGAESP